MNKTLRKIILITLFLGFLCHSACLDPIDDSFDKSESDLKTLVINEILASSSQGGYDWIELYNPGEDPVYLKDYSIVDDNTEHDPFRLPYITLYPNDFLVLYATEKEPEDGSYYVPFRLGADDSLTLYWGLAIVDVLDWEEGQAPDGCSYGLFPDGIDPPITLMPTKDNTNKRIFRPPLVINEIVASPDIGKIDWIEFYVDSNEPVNLGDYVLMDDGEGHKPSPLPGIELSPGEFFVIPATDEDPNDGSYYFPYGLGADDGLTLLSKDSNIVMDMLDWEDGDAPSGYSFGCLPDGTKLNGTKELQTLIPTKGYANEG